LLFVLLLHSVQYFGVKMNIWIICDKTLWLFVDTAVRKVHS